MATKKAFLKRICLFLFALAVIFSKYCTAQTNQPEILFTGADSLRGSLNVHRTCFDVLFYHLDISIDPEYKTLIGSNLIKFLAVDSLSRIQLDLFPNMQVDKIVWQGLELPYSRNEGAVLIDFPKIIAKGAVDSLRFYYQGKPKIARNAPWDGGFVWRKDAQGNVFAGVSCQGVGASSWWPCKDHNSDKPDSMRLSFSVPDTLQAISNGRFLGKQKLTSELTRYDWQVSYPIVPYSMSVNIGKYTHFKDSLKGLSLDYYVLPENLEAAQIQFKQVGSMLTCYEDWFGSYPFKKDGYKIIETPYLGMEHQSGIGYGNQYKNGYLGKDLTGSGWGHKFDFILIHESAHEWFGNSLTAADLADLWIQESFTCYAEALYIDCLYGKKAYLSYLNGYKNLVKNDRPMFGTPGVNHVGSSDMYYKGALMLNTLSHVIDNQEIWRKVLKGLPTAFAYQSTDGAAVIALISKIAGQDLSKIIDQYVNYAQIPILCLRQTSPKTVSYQWISPVKDFNMPIKISTKGADLKAIFPTSSPQFFENTLLEDIEIPEDCYYITVDRIALSQ